MKHPDAEKVAAAIRALRPEWLVEHDEHGWGALLVEAPEVQGGWGRFGSVTADRWVCNGYGRMFLRDRLLRDGLAWAGPFTGRGWHERAARAVVEMVEATTDGGLGAA